MLRSLVLVLLLVNAGFYAWTHGWLNSVVGVQADAQHEPQRLNQQVHPERLIVLPQGAASRAEAASAVAAANAPICLEAGPFDSAETAQATGSLASVLPAGSWTNNTVSLPGEYLVYMGPYPDPEMYARKIMEIKRMRSVTLEEVQSPPALARGLSLGRFNRQDEAVAALEAWKARGIRTARVVTARPPMELQMVRVPQADARTQTALGSVKLPAGKSFSVCQSSP